jgi:hypothetical protein
MERFFLPLLCLLRLTENSTHFDNLDTTNIAFPCLVFMQKFKTVNNEQLYLLPPSVEDFTPASQLARVINKEAEKITT